jgi:hypothetical protein
VLAVSADFVRKADIAGCSRASLFLSSDGMRLAFRFHNDEKDDDAFILGRDGGGRGSGINRAICARTLFDQSATLYRLVEENVSARRYEPIKIDGGRWMIAFAPCFERDVIDPKELPDNESGIYRYVRGKEIIYIGKGNYRERCLSPERKSWQFDQIEFSRLNDEVAEAQWESFWLNEHRRQHGHWPFHNRIGGVVAS